MAPFVIGREEEVDPPLLDAQNTPLPDYVKNILVYVLCSIYTDIGWTHYRGVGAQENIWGKRWSEVF